MGLDGGLKTHRPEMVQTKNVEQTRNLESIKSQSYSDSCWTECSLTGMPLQSPILVSNHGTLFNKESVLNSIINHSIPKRLSYIKKMKNMKEIDLMGAKNLLEYVCPISGKSPSKGTKEMWIVLFKCGHLFLESSLKQIGCEKTCPVCGEAFDDNDIIEINNFHEISKKK